MTSRALRGGAWAVRGTKGGDLLSFGIGTASLRGTSAFVHASLRCGPPLLQIQTQTLRSSHFGSVSGKPHPDGAMSSTEVLVSRCGDIGSGLGNGNMLRPYRHPISMVTMTIKDCGRYVPRVEPRNLRRYFSYKARYLDREGKDGRQQPTPQPSSAPAPRGIRKVLPKSIGAFTPHENIYTVPNLLTFSRLIAAPFIGYAILHDAHTWALGLFVYAGVSDLLDGWIARRWNLQTVVGSVVDPMADKILMTILTVCLAAKGALPVWLAVIILGRDVGLGIAAIYYRWISLPPPKTFTRYWDFSLPSAEVRPTTISKYNTFLQLALMGATTVAPLVTGMEVGPALVGLQYIVATTTVWSGLSYVFSKDAVKILSQSKGKDTPKSQDESKDP